MPQGEQLSLWLATNKGLFVWENEMLVELVPENLPTSNAILASGAPYDGDAAVWVATDKWLYAVLPKDDDYVAIPVHDNLPIAAMTVDQDQRLWILSDGNIVVRETDGEWLFLEFDEHVKSIHSRTNSKVTWITLPKSVVVHQDGKFFPVEGLTGAPTADMADDASLVVANDKAVTRIKLPTEGPKETIGWALHIEPIYLTKCKGCHSPDNIASDLSSQETWQTKIGTIMTKVKTTMPADNPPLDPTLTSMIQQWIDGGFAK